MSPSIKYSEKLKQNILIQDDGSVITEDETKYNKNEMRLLNNCSDEMIYQVHRVKKFFEGEVVGEKQNK